MGITTELTRALGIVHPIVCGGMHYVGYAGLAAAVSNGGGLGVITALTQPDPESLRAEIRQCKSLTDKPFGVNLTLLPALSPPNYGAFAEVVVDEGVKIIETAGHYKGLQPFVDLFKAEGAYVIHKCTTTRHAKTAQRMGVDMISMDGFECGGHPGESDIGNFVLFALAAKELDIPWIASGGCADGRQLAASLAFGAQGMNMGTRFMATVEAPIHDNIKRAIVEGDVYGTTHVMRSLRNTERVYKNDAAERVIAIEQEHPGDIEAIRPLVRGDNYRTSFQETGNTEDSVWSCGLSMGLIDDCPPCADVIENIVKEAESIITDLPNVLR